MSYLARAQETLRLFNPPLRDKYEMLEDVRKLQEIDRADKEGSKCNARNIEDDITKKIVAALEKEKHDELLAKARYKKLTQMSQDLHQLNHYLVSAESTMELVAQLKKEDDEIDRRAELAIKQAKQIREEIREMEDHEKQKEIELSLKKTKLREQLRLQIAEKEDKRKKREINRLREENERREIDKLEKEKKLLELQGTELLKRKQRMEALERIRQRQELSKQESDRDRNFLLIQKELQLKRDEFDQSIKDARKKRIQDRMKIGEKIGLEVLAANNAKTQRINDLIESLYIENEYGMKNLDEEKEKKLNEKRKEMQYSMQALLEEKSASKKNIFKKTNDLAQKRLTETHHDTEIDQLRKRMERERLEIEQFLKGQSMDRADLKAENTTSVVGTEELKDREDIEAIRLKILHEQPISLLRYLPPSLLKTDYLPQPMLDRVREQVRNDPIPVFNIKRHQGHIKLAKAVGGEPVICCKSCPPRNRISNIF